MPRMEPPYILHPDLETMDESMVLFPGQRVKWKDCWAVVIDESCPECGHVGAPHPPFIRMMEGDDANRRLCLCCGWIDQPN